MSGFDHLYGWIKGVSRKQSVPPFVVELFLRDGRRYYLHSIGHFDEESESVAIRIWDFRAFAAEEDMAELKNKITEIEGKFNIREMRAEKIHPKLDWGILRVHLSEIAYCVEWHDRSWPEEDRPEEIGYKTS